MDEQKETKISLSIHTVVGIIAGYMSSMFGEMLYSLGIAIALLAITGYAVSFALKKKGMKWWLANGGVIYILVWVLVWVFAFNLPA